MNGEPLVELRDVTVRYKSGPVGRRRREVVAVDTVSLAVQPQQTVGLVGTSGSGKSTLAKLVTGMVAPDAGTVRVAGHDLRDLTDQAAAEVKQIRQVVLQDPFSSLNPRMRVSEIIAEPLHGLPGMTARKNRQARVTEVLELVGLAASRGELYPHQFSGGQRQRISIARALAPRPDLIVLDEPTSALDVSVRAQILNLLKDLQAELGLTYLAISHDFVVVSFLATTLAVMDQGRIVELGPTEAVSTGPRHPYTAQLLTSVPDATGRFLAQERARPAAVDTAGCPFAPRCVLRQQLGEPERCVTERPELGADDAGPHRAACHFSDELLSSPLVAGSLDETPPPRRRLVEAGA